MIRGKSILLQRYNRSAHQTNRVEREMRIHLYLDAVVARPSIQFEHHVLALGRNRNRRRVSSRLENPAKQNRPIHDLRAVASRQRRKLSVGEIAERTSVVEVKFNLFSHRQPS